MPSGLKKDQNQKKIPILFQYDGGNNNPFYSPYMSSVQPLENGNYLVNVAAMRKVFEITPEKEIVWDFFLPIDETARRGKNGKIRGEGAFNVERYPTKWVAFEGKDLTPKATLGNNNFDCYTYPPLYFTGTQLDKISELWRMIAPFFEWKSVYVTFNK